MNLATVKSLIETLELRKAPHQATVNSAKEKIKKLDHQIEALHELLGTTPAPHLPSRKLVRGGAKVARGSNDAAALEIIGRAKAPMTAEDVRAFWPGHLKPQSIYPTLKDLVFRKRKLDRIQVSRDIGKKPCFAYMIKGKLEARHMGSKP